MNRLYSLKRILTFIIAFAVTAGIAGSSYNSSLKITSADTESSQGEDYSYTDSVADGGQQSDEQTENDDNSQEESTGFDITQYAEQLRELSKKQTEINEQLDQYDEDIEKSEKKQKLLKEKIDSINDEIDVLNSYMTALELQINTNQRNIDKKQAEINKAIEDFKQRLRAKRIQEGVPANASKTVNQVMLDEIRRERALELYMEGFRCDDLKRWGIAEENLNESRCGAVVGNASYPTAFIDENGNATSAFNPAIFTKGTEEVETGKGKLPCVVLLKSSDCAFTKGDYLWAIPRNQINLNSNLVQNPGY